MTEPFRYFVRVRYSECDAQHVVFNARYADYADLACTELLKAAFPGRDMFDGSFEIQVVRQLTEWKAPARFDDVLEISVGVVRFGNTSLTMHMDFRKAGSPDVIVTVETVYVVVDSQTWTKRPITAEERDGLERGAAGKIVDHAGYHAIVQGKRLTDGAPRG
jgi:acyl-CoA thioester hydrolase